ncbi:MAG: GspH/FimT family pseudopilin, partial [Mariprofundales bacterium]|nr:GspH/FimT family pseudopilin [Mariprofundales bacterium]
AIIGIIAGFALPSYSKWRASQGVSSATNTLMGHLKQARHLAIGENRSVAILVDPSQYTFDKTSVQQNTIMMLQYDSPTLTASPANNTFTFASRGTVNSGNITISSGSFCKKITINGIGRAYFATPPSPCP